MFIYEGRHSETIIIFWGADEFFQVLEGIRLKGKKRRPKTLLLILQGGEEQEKKKSRNDGNFYC